MLASELVEVEAQRDVYAAGPGLVREIGSVTCLALPALPKIAAFNHAIGVVPETTEDALDEICRFYEELSVEYMVSPAGPGPEPRLEARGLAPGYAWAKFTRRPEPPATAETDLHVERVAPVRAAEFGRVVTSAFGLPDRLASWSAALVGRAGWTCYLTLAGEEPAGAAALFVSDGLAWLGLGCTLPQFRRRGSQSALFAARIEDAREQGAELLVTETGVPAEGRPSNSYRNILRAGFEIAYVRPNYQPRGSASQADAPE